MHAETLGIHDGATPHPLRYDESGWGMLYGLTNWEITMAELFSDAGYPTGMVGKWHVGGVPGRFATDQGFDEWCGVANSTDESGYSSQFPYDAKSGTKPCVQEARKGEKVREEMPYDLQARREIDAELTRRAIDEPGVRDETLVVWFSDDGPESFYP